MREVDECGLAYKKLLFSNGRLRKNQPINRLLYISTIQYSFTYLKIFVVLHQAPYTQSVPYSWVCSASHIIHIDQKLGFLFIYVGC